MTNPEIATGAYKDSDRAVRPGVRPQQGSRRVGTRKRQDVVKNATGRSDQAARSRRSKDLRTRPIRPSRSQGLRLTLTEQGHVLGLRSRTAIY
ncbi:hypothetical protein Taro_032835 [Colocasia esculenta]|uniref:Uncharacterized protein n=1 Tax=Colocasia esculenta TaxID=4460 RepID=A0A843W7A1_COLES|nr:hypothetical protein [Colocasia esculenta]